MRWSVPSGVPSIIAIAALCASVPAASQTGGQEPPRSWIDADTGHRIVRLTNEPGSAGLYFNQNGYTADGLKMIYTTPEEISALDLATHTAKAVVTGKVRVIVTGRTAPNVYYIRSTSSREGAVYSKNIDTGATREIAKLPPRGSVVTVNADETLMAGTSSSAGCSAFSISSAMTPSSKSQRKTMQDLVARPSRRSRLH